MLLGGAVAPPWGCCSTLLQTVCWDLVRVSRMKVSHNMDIVSLSKTLRIFCIPAAT